jgi:hypothetical protein
MKMGRFSWIHAQVSLALALGTANAAEGPWADLEAQVKKVAEAVAPTAEEKAFDRIGWARDLREAERLSRESKRPVFLFTHDGRINTGRC